MSEGFLVLHVFEAVLADPQLGLFAVVLRKRREVPGVDLKVSYLDLVHVLHFSDLTETRWVCFKLTGKKVPERDQRTERPPYRLMLLLQRRRGRVHLCVCLQNNLHYTNTNDSVNTSGTAEVCD